jgi:predicted nuclease with TOPRIM domain
LLTGVRLLAMAKDDRSEALRNEIEELREEAAALADRAKKTARQTETLSERIKHLETQIAKQVLATR